MFPCFKKGKSPRVVPNGPIAIPEPTIDEMTTYRTVRIKLAIVVGHNMKKQGANNYLGESEWVFNSRIARKLQIKLAALGIESVIIFRPYNVSYKKQCKSVAEQIEEHNCTHAILLHFNDASGESAMGVEVLVARTSTLEDDEFADTITDILNEEYDFIERRDDGVYTVGDSHNGSGMINAVNRKKCITALIEICFAGYSNRESKFIFENEDLYVDVIVRAVVKSWGREIVSRNLPNVILAPIDFEILDENRYSIQFSRLVHAIKKSDQNPALKSIILAQFIKESGRGNSKLAKEFWNFGGLKWRPEMSEFGSPISYEAWDGRTDYIKFTSPEAFIKGYWAFIARYPYNGWEQFKNDPFGYIKFINKCGYTPPMSYHHDVIKLYDEAKELLK
jgi:N-acetylmuramoyl-L-alanine amidase